MEITPKLLLMQIHFLLLICQIISREWDFGWKIISEIQKILIFLTKHLLITNRHDVYI
jgi:hypothetical protein